MSVEAKLRLIGVISIIVIISVISFVCTSCSTTPPNGPVNSTTLTTTTSTTTDTSTTSTTAGAQIGWREIGWEGPMVDHERQRRAFVEVARRIGYGNDPRLRDFVLSNHHVNGDRYGGALGWVCNDCSCFAWNQDNGNLHHHTRYCVKPSNDPASQFAPYQTCTHEQGHSVDDIIPAADRRRGNGNPGHDQFWRHKTTKEWLPVTFVVNGRWPMRARKPSGENWWPMFRNAKSPPAWVCPVGNEDGTAEGTQWR